MPNALGQPTRATDPVEGQAADQPSDVLRVDPVWQAIRQRAEQLSGEAPSLAAFVNETVLRHATLEQALAHLLAVKLGTPLVSALTIRGLVDEALAGDQTLGPAMRADLSAVVERDPATVCFLEAFLYLKGFHGLQSYRVAHWLWGEGRHMEARYLQSRVSELFGVDIHPGARIGKGVMIDHATAVVIGETAVVEDDVSMLHNVTLGGTGKVQGDRHPKIRKGVLIGAGAKILGNIEVGHCSKVASGSVVLSAVPPCKTVAGVPATIRGESGCSKPSHAMDQTLYGSEEGFRSETAENAPENVADNAPGDVPSDDTGSRVKDKSPAKDAAP